MMLQRKSTSNLMAPPLLGGESSRTSGYSAIPSSSSSYGAPVQQQPQQPSAFASLASAAASAAAAAASSRDDRRTRTVEEAAQSGRERLPGRSKKAKDQYRRQQRGERGDQWRGRLSGYCASDSLDCAKLTKHLKDQQSADQNEFDSSLLYTRKWRVKAYFDVLHLHSTGSKAAVDAGSAGAGAGAPVLMHHQDSENESMLMHEGGGGGGGEQRGFESAGYYDTEDEQLQQQRRRASPDGTDPPVIVAPAASFSPAPPPPPSSSSSQQQPAEEELDVFLFGFGPVVFWGFANEQAERDVLKDLVPFVEGEWHDPVAAEGAREEMEFVTPARGSSSGGAWHKDSGDDAHSNSAFGLGVLNDLIELTAQQQGGGRRSKPAAEKLAISSALAQSCHLSIYESRLSDTISRYSHIPKKLAEEGKIDMTGDEISREIGRLFVERNLINLEPELLDTPEFLWNDSEFEPLYKNVYRYLEVEPRIEVLNKRLSIVGELLEVLKSQQEHQHASHLEFIVVVLISLEVVIQLVWNILLKDVLGWIGQPGDY